MHQPYNEVMCMDRETRDEFFKIELDEINRQNNNGNNVAFE